MSVCAVNPDGRQRRKAVSEYTAQGVGGYSGGCPFGVLHAVYTKRSVSLKAGAKA